MIDIYMVLIERSKRMNRNRNLIINFNLYCVDGDKKTYVPDHIISPKHGKSVPKNKATKKKRKKK